MKSERRKRLFVALGCLLGAVSELATIGETWQLGQITGVLGGQGGAIWSHLILVAVMVVLEYLSNTLGIWVKQMGRRRIVMDLRRQLFEKSVRMEYLRLKERDSGDLNSLYLSDVDVIGQYYGTFMDSFGQIAGGVAAVLACTLISWKFLLINLCIFPVILLLGELSGRNLKKYAYMVQQKKGAAAAALLDAIRNKNMARSYSAQEYMIARYTQAGEEENRAAMLEARKKGIAGGFNSVIGGMPLLAIFVIGGVLVFRGEIALGEFFTFAFIFGNIQSLQGILALRVAKKGAAAARRRLDEFLMQPDEEDRERNRFTENDKENDGSRLYENGLYLSDVSFAYESGPDIFRGLSLCIKKGDSVGFVGESGSGKSTLLGLLTGLYEPREGTVSYRCEEGCREGGSCREKLAVVFQDNYLFPATIRENLLMGKPDASQEELLSACERAGILEDIERMPKGLDTVVSEQGQSLSGGQRQRLCIARALVRNPEILIMDEPSASLDTVHEVRLMERMAEVMKEGILIVVSHRQSAIRKLGTVYSLEDGVLRKLEA